MINRMISSTPALSISGGSSAEIYSDQERDNYGLGEDLTFNLNSTDNIAIGEKALNSTGNAALGNIGIGTDVLTANSTGDYNVAIGYQAGKILTTSGDNVLIGSNTGLAIAAGQILTNGTVAIGKSALAALTSGAYSTAIGYNALTALTDGGNNTAIGYAAGDLINTGGNNTLIGVNAGGNFNDDGGNTVVGANALNGAVNGASEVVAIGKHAMQGAVTQDGTVAIGSSALAALTSGVGNVAIGYQALASETDGARNIAIGLSALTSADASEDDNIAIGYEAMKVFNHDDAHRNIGIGSFAGTAMGAFANIDNIFIGSSSGGGTWATAASSYNIGIGSYTLDGALNEALNNTAIGHQALTALNTGDDNVAIGYQCGDGITAGDYNTAVGSGALGAGAGAGNAAIGYQTLIANTGAYNVAMGYQVMFTSAAVDNCVALGHSALYTANTDTADGTVAIGCGAGMSYVPADAGAATGGTTLIGYNAGNDPDNTAHGLTTGIQNTAVGHESLGANANAALTGNANTVMGYRAGYGLTGVGHDNTAIGMSSGLALTAGIDNTFIGAYSGQNQTTGNFNVCMGYGATTPNGNNNEGAIGSYGGLQFLSFQVSCTYGGEAINDPAHAAPVGKIPRYAVITRATVVVTTLSSDANHTLKLVLASNSSGSDNTALSNVQELIGAASTNSWGSTGAAGAAAGINVASGADVNTAYVAIPYDPAGATNSGLAAIDTTAQDLFVYLAFADTAYGGDNDNPSTAPIVRVYVEFAGQD